MQNQQHNLDPSQQRKLQQFLMNSMIHDNLSMLISITNDCFTQCVHEFPSKTNTNEEMSCIENCADRYLKLRLRIGQKFQYYQALKVAQLKKEREMKVNDIGRKE